MSSHDMRLNFLPLLVLIKLKEFSNKFTVL